MQEIKHMENMTSLTLSMGRLWKSSKLSWGANESFCLRKLI